ncbi:MAG: ABC transporter permease [Acidimicrobiia bacterium]|nr:ABC transporter permease [Acidimicrobiia bacterium]
MTRLRTLLSRLIALSTSRRAEQDLRDEIDTHIDLAANEHARDGAAPDEARARARREFGGVEQVKEVHRDGRGFPALEAWVRDLRFAARSLVRTPTFSLAAVATFAIGIGATTAVYAVVQGVLLQPLPFPNAERAVRIVQLLEPNPQPGAPQEPMRAGLYIEQFRQWRQETRTLARLTKYSVLSATLTGVRDPVRLSGASVSPGFFETFGVAPLIGRTFTDEEEHIGTPPVVMLSHATWMRLFGGAADILGTSLTLNGDTRRVVGVMPATFNLPALAGPVMSRSDSGQLGVSPEFWVPSPLPPPRPGPVTGYSLFPAIGLLKPGVTPAEATAEANAILGQLPTGRPRLGMEIVRFQDEMVRSVRSVILLFQLAVVAVLLIACANVANLFLARAADRQRELAVRMALGGSRWDIMRRAIAEALLVSTAGGAIGIWLAGRAVNLLQALPPDTLPRLASVKVNEVVLGVGLAVCGLSGVLTGAFVAIRSLRTPILPALQHGTAAGAARGARPSSVLLVAQMAGAVVLLACAGLLLNSFVQLTTIDHGFRTEQLLTFRLTLPTGRYQSARQAADFWAALEGALARVPGVASAAVSTALPFQSTNIGFWPLTIDGVTTDSEVTYTAARPDYFEALGTRFLRGRGLAAGDGAAEAVVNEAFVRRYLGPDNPLGRTVRFEQSPVYEIVGVIQDTRRGLGLGDMAPFLFPEIVVSSEQPIDTSPGWLAGLTVAVRVNGSDPLAVLPGVKRAVRALDPTLPVYNAASVDQLAREANAASRLYAIVAAVFGSAAVLLACVGLYGLLACSISSRTHELGIRRALGCHPSAVVRREVGRGLRLVSIGIALGLAATPLTWGTLSRLLFGLTPRDPATLATVCAVLLLVAFIAAYLPARRASRIDPMAALRCE